MLWLNLPVFVPTNLAENCFPRYPLKISCGFWLIDDNNAVCDHWCESLLTCRHVCASWFSFVCQHLHGHKKNTSGSRESAPHILVYHSYYSPSSRFSLVIKHWFQNKFYARVIFPVMKQLFEQDVKLDQLFSCASVSWHIFRHQVFVRKSHLPVLFKDRDFCGADWKYIFSFQRTIRSVCACVSVFVCVCLRRCNWKDSAKWCRRYNECSPFKISVLSCLFHILLWLPWWYIPLLFGNVYGKERQRERQVKGGENARIQETCTRTCVRTHALTHTHTHTVCGVF